MIFFGEVEQALLIVFYINGCEIAHSRRSDTVILNDRSIGFFKFRQRGVTIAADTYYQYVWMQDECAACIVVRAETDDQIGILDCFNLTQPRG